MQLQNGWPMGLNFKTRKVKMLLQPLKYGLIALALTVLTACGQDDPNALKVGVMAGPEEQLMETAKQVAARDGLDIKIVTFSNYNIPNAALSDGSIDANMFQHMPFLEQQIKDHGYKIVAIGKTFVYPMGIYSRKIKSLDQLSNG